MTVPRRVYADRPPRRRRGPAPLLFVWDWGRCKLLGHVADRTRVVDWQRELDAAGWRALQGEPFSAVVVAARCSRCGELLDAREYAAVGPRPR